MNIYKLGYAVLAAIALAQIAAADDNPGADPTRVVEGNTVIAHGPNFLTVKETIAPAGIGTWNYTYSFVNDDPSPIWHFFVYTPYPTTRVSVAGFPESASVALSLDGVNAPYDARNLDPTLTHGWNAWYTPFNTVGLPHGSPAALTVQANVLNTAPKLFAYETLASGYAGQGQGPGGSLGRVAAFGYTVPEPNSLLLIGMGIVGILVRGRRR